MTNATLVIDDQNITVAEGANVLQAALDAGIYIPHLCHHPDLPDIGACRMCVVELDGSEDIVSSCSLAAKDGMVIRTKTERLNKFRRLAMELILSSHDEDCTNCPKNSKCELQSLKEYLNTSPSHMRRITQPSMKDTQNPLFIRDNRYCVLCGRCVRMCNDVRGVNVLDYRRNQYGEVYIGPWNDISMQSAACRFCCSCVEVCPTGALRDKDELIDKNAPRSAALVPCREKCPAHIDIPKYIRFLKQGDYSRAIAVVREKVPFPLTLGYVCTCECEIACRRNIINEAVSINELKRSAGRHHNDAWKIRSLKKPDTGKKVAVIGSGPAGLTGGYYLRKSGHAVTIFEALPEAGGMLRVGTPAYRLPLNVLQSEIDEIRQVGVEIRTGICVESIDELFSAGYDAVVVAVGTHKGFSLPIPGADLKNVYVSTEFLRDVRLGKPPVISETVAVLGGGNVAIDCARTAIRSGSKNVYLICAEQREAMPAIPREIRQAEDEGVKICNGRAFIGISDKNGTASGVECMTAESFFFDENKMININVVKNSQHVVPAETVIFAIGQRPQIPEGFNLELNSENTVKVSGTMTSKRGVFACGDAVNGTSTVIKAIEAGRNVASAVDQYLGGDGNIEEKLCDEQNIQKRIGRKENFMAMKRQQPHISDPKERRNSFEAVNADLLFFQMKEESNRCLQCDLRLSISKPKFAMEYSENKQSKE